MHDLYFDINNAIENDRTSIMVDYWVAEEAPIPEPTPALTLEYNVNNWGSGYNVDFNVVNNTDSAVVGWVAKIKKSDCKINSSWSVNVEETDDYYVIIPMDWNTIIGAHGSTSFGIQGSGEIGSSIGYVLE